MNPYVVVGGGPAAAAAARVLTAAGVVVLTAEDVAPYDRTTLSKGLHLEVPPPALWQDGEPRLDLRTSQRVDALDLEARTVSTSAGDTIGYHKLLLATGAEPRRLALPGAHGPGVHYLRDAADSVSLRRAVRDADRVVILGGGVIGLEVAASLRQLGRDIHVAEAAPRCLGRGVPDAVADWIVDLHGARGVRFTTGVAPTQVLRTGGHVVGVGLADGTKLPADLVVIGVGVSPREELARAAGLAVDDGILVDRSCRTSHPDVYAAGDCARMRATTGDRGTRLESYQAAGRHGEVAAEAMLGGSGLYADVAWSWSDQYDSTMQSAGLATATSEAVVCRAGDAVLVLSFDGDALVAACGVATGSAIARPIRAAQQAISAGAALDRVAITAASDLPAVTRLLTASASSAATPVGGLLSIC